MKLTNLTKNLALTMACCLAAACGSAEPAEPQSETLTKQEAQRRMERADNTTDFCDFMGWYGDGICDDWCPQPDPDCGAPDEPGDDDQVGCASDADCAAGEYCELPVCLTWCPAGDATCCGGGVCQPNSDPDECVTDADCGDGEYCQPGMCLMYCSVDDEDCCGPNQCVPAPDPDPAPEGDQCQTDADCGSGESCEESICPAFCAEGARCCPLVCVPEPPTNCQSDADCSAGEVCDEQICPWFCDGSDPNCCPGQCKAPEAADECETDADCASDEMCQPGVCLMYCSVDDPECCARNTCVPR